MSKHIEQFLNGFWMKISIWLHITEPTEHAENNVEPQVAWWRCHVHTVRRNVTQEYIESSREQVYRKSFPARILNKEETQTTEH